MLLVGNKKSMLLKKKHASQGLSQKACFWYQEKHASGL
jgi:hypothetical protein